MTQIQEDDIAWFHNMWGDHSKYESFDNIDSIVLEMMHQEFLKDKENPIYKSIIVGDYTVDLGKLEII